MSEHYMAKYTVKENKCTKILTKVKNKFTSQHNNSNLCIYDRVYLRGISKNKRWPSLACFFPTLYLRWLISFFPPRKTVIKELQILQDAWLSLHHSPFCESEYSVGFERHLQDFLALLCLVFDRNAFSSVKHIHLTWMSFLGLFLLSSWLLPSKLYFTQQWHFRVRMQICFKFF